jgi:hypothetical protein
MRGGWFHTGDVAYMDKDGYFFIIDRKKDMIIRGAYNIHPNIYPVSWKRCSRLPLARFLKARVARPGAAAKGE